MDQLTPDVIYLILLLVVPGLISQGVFEHFIERGKRHEFDVYQGLINSFYIYIVLYPIVILIWGDLTQTINWFQSSSWAPLITAGVTLLASLVWGYLRALIYISKPYDWISKKLRCSAAEPPNVYAALLDKKYKDDDIPKVFWITAKVDNEIIVGNVKQYALNEAPREIYLENAARYTLNGALIKELSENEGIVLRIDDITMVEIKVQENNG